MAYQAQPERQTGVAPSWVEFSSDVKVSQGGRVEWDRVFRGVDGSLRTEQYDENGQTYAIAISSVREQRLYQWLPARGWTITPTRIAAAPPQGVNANWTRVAAEATASKLDGFKFTNRKGVETILAPALNFYAIETRNPEFGQERILVNVKIGAQDPNLFVPPDEARQARVVEIDHLAKNAVLKVCRPSDKPSKGE